MVVSFQMQCRHDFRERDSENNGNWLSISDMIRYVRSSLFPSNTWAIGPMIDSSSLYFTISPSAIIWAVPKFSHSLTMLWRTFSNASPWAPVQLFCWDRVPRLNRCGLLALQGVPCQLCMRITMPTAPKTSALEIIKMFSFWQSYKWIIILLLIGTCSAPRKALFLPWTAGAQ